MVTALTDQIIEPTNFQNLKIPGVLETVQTQALGTPFWTSEWLEDCMSFAPDIGKGDHDVRRLRAWGSQPDWDIWSNLLVACAMFVQCGQD